MYCIRYRSIEHTGALLHRPTNIMFTFTSIVIDTSILMEAEMTKYFKPKQLRIIATTKKQDNMGLCTHAILFGEAQCRAGPTGMGCKLFQKWSPTILN